jgi:hypothetical protein
MYKASLFAGEAMYKHTKPHFSLGKKHGKGEKAFGRREFGADLYSNKLEWIRKKTHGMMES